MRLTTRTNLALRTLMVCAANSGRVIRKAEIAATCNASENHLAQVIHLLARRGLVKTLRGRSGGLTLGQPAHTITIGAVLRDFEPCLPFTDCSNAGAKACPLSGACRLPSVFSDALDAFYAKLDGVTLADLMRDNRPLHHLLQVA